MIDGFVPPIFDLLDPNGHFKMKEAEISALNAEIASAEARSEVDGLKDELKAAEDAMKALDVLVKMEYKIKSDTEMEVTAKAFLGLGGKESETITYSLDGDNLTFDGVAFTRAKEE